MRLAAARGLLGLLAQLRDASGTRSGWVRSTSAASRSSSSCSRISVTAAGPVIASMRRTFAALEPSLTIRNSPISAVVRTCVPPHSSRERPPSPISTIRTTSPYFSPNSAIAPSALASSSVVVIGRTGRFSRIRALTSSSTWRRSSSLSFAVCVKSKRSLSGPTYEPAWRTWSPSRARSAACSRCVAVWLHAVAWRAARSTLRDDALARRAARPRRALDDERLVVAGAHDVDDLDAAVAVLAGDDARVADLAAALGVERGLGELHEHAAVVLVATPWTTVWTSRSS